MRRLRLAPSRRRRPESYITRERAHQSTRSGRFWGSRAGCHPGKNHRAKRRLKPTWPCVPLAVPNAEPEEANMDYSRIERCHCDSSTDSRNVHDVNHVRGSARSLMAENLTQDPDDAVVFGATVLIGAIVQQLIQDFFNENRSINPNEVLAFERHPVHGVGSNSHSHEERAQTRIAS